MKKLRSLVRSFARATAGTTSIEYAIIGAFVSIAILVGVTSLATNLNVTFARISNGLS